MPAVFCTRRRFLVTSSVVMGTGVAVAAQLGSGLSSASRELVSAERAGAGTRWFKAQALVLEGPRIERLQVMTNSLIGFSGEIILRLDAVDDHLLDVAAEQAGVTILRGNATPNLEGILALVASQKRTLP